LSKPREGFDINPAERKQPHEEGNFDFGRTETDNVLGSAVLLSGQKDSKHDADKGTFDRAERK
jgi:hypothetical protein